MEYIENRDKYDYLLKILVVGKALIGKTIFVNRLYDEE